MTEERAVAVVDNNPVGEPKPEQALAKPAPTNLMPVSYEGIACAAFAKEETAALMAAVAPTDIEIKPDGIVYYPEMCYRRVLHKAFGPGAWALRPVSGITNMENVVYREFALYVHGRFVGQAVGQNEYQPTNKQMTWGYCVEGAKSNALSRICKDIGIATELWDKTFIEKWKAEYAVKVYNEEKRKYEWRRKDREPFFWEKKSPSKPVTANAPALADKIADAMQKQGGGSGSKPDVTPRPTEAGVRAAVTPTPSTTQSGSGVQAQPVQVQAGAAPSHPPASTRFSPPVAGHKAWPVYYVHAISDKTTTTKNGSIKHGIKLAAFKAVGGSRSDDAFWADLYTGGDDNGEGSERLAKLKDAFSRNVPMHFGIKEKKGTGQYAGRTFRTIEECEFVEQPTQDDAGQQAADDYDNDPGHPGPEEEPLF